MALVPGLLLPEGLELVLGDWRPRRKGCSVQPREEPSSAQMLYFSIAAPSPLPVPSSFVKLTRY